MGANCRFVFFKRALVPKYACRPSSGCPATRIDAGPELVRQRRAGLSRAFADPALKSVRDASLIEGFDVLRPADYGCMAEIASDAKRRRYLELD